MNNYQKYWKEQCKSGEHYCNRVTDPGTCCPKGHNINAKECTCWIENETYIDADRKKYEMSERYHVTQFRRLMGILPKHTISLKTGKWAMCHLKNGGGPFEDDGICHFCKGLVWY
jgi:hypothetical protein